MPHHYKDAISYMNEPMASGRRTRREGCHVFLTNGFLFHTATDQGPLDHADELTEDLLLTDNAKVLFS